MEMFTFHISKGYQNCKFQSKFDTKFEYAEFNGDPHFFCFRRETPFFGKFSLMKFSFSAEI